MSNKQKQTKTMKHFAILLMMLFVVTTFMPPDTFDSPPDKVEFILQEDKSIEPVFIADYQISVQSDNFYFQDAFPVPNLLFAKYPPEKQGFYLVKYDKYLPEKQLEDNLKSPEIYSGNEKPTDSWCNESGLV